MSEPMSEPIATDVSRPPGNPDHPTTSAIPNEASVPALAPLTDAEYRALDGRRFIVAVVDEDGTRIYPPHYEGLTLKGAALVSRAMALAFAAEWEQTATAEAAAAARHARETRALLGDDDAPPAPAAEAGEGE